MSSRCFASRLAFHVSAVCLVPAPRLHPLVPRPIPRPFILTIGLPASTSSSARPFALRCSSTMVSGLRMPATRHQWRQSFFMLCPECPSLLSSCIPRPLPAACSSVQASVSIQCPAVLLFHDQWRIGFPVKRNECEDEHACLANYNLLPLLVRCSSGVLPSISIYERRMASPSIHVSSLYQSLTPRHRKPAAVAEPTVAEWKQSDSLTQKWEPKLLLVIRIHH